MKNEQQKKIIKQIRTKKTKLTMNKNNVFTILKNIEKFKTILQQMKHDNKRSYVQWCEITNIENSIKELEHEILNYED